MLCENIWACVPLYQVTTPEERHTVLERGGVLHWLKHGYTAETFRLFCLFSYTERNRLSPLKREVKGVLLPLSGAWSAVTVFQGEIRPEFSFVPVKCCYSLWMVFPISLFSWMSTFRLSRHSLFSFCCLAISSCSWMIRSCSRPREWLEKTKVPERSLGTSPNTTYSIYKTKTKQSNNQNETSQRPAEGKAVGSLSSLPNLSFLAQ